MSVPVQVGTTAVEGVDSWSLGKVNDLLRGQGLPEHVEPPRQRGGRKLGRAPADTVPGPWLQEFVQTEVASGDDRTHLAALNLPGDGFFLPRPMDRPLRSADGSTWIASSVGLLAELRQAAEGLDIPSFSDALPDPVAAAIVAEEPLSEGDEPSEWAEQREVWLCLYEAARISVADGSVMWLG